MSTHPSQLGVVFFGLPVVVSHCWYVGVSKNRGTPKSSILIGFSIINHPFWGTLIFGNTYVGDLMSHLVGGFKDVLFSPRFLGEDSQFDEHIFQGGWNHQQVMIFTWNLQKKWSFRNRHWFLSNGATGILADERITQKTFPAELFPPVGKGTSSTQI